MKISGLELKDWWLQNYSPQLENIYDSNIYNNSIMYYACTLNYANKSKQRAIDASWYSHLFRGEDNWGLDLPLISISPWSLTNRTKK